MADTQKENYCDKCNMPTSAARFCLMKSSCRSDIHKGAVRAPIVVFTPDSLNEVHSIVERLSGGNLPLSKSIVHYDETDDDVVQHIAQSLSLSYSQPEETTTLFVIRKFPSREFLDVLRGTGVRYYFYNPNVPGAWCVHEPLMMSLSTAGKIINAIAWEDLLNERRLHAIQSEQDLEDVLYTRIAAVELTRFHTSC
nr:MAG: hypothetical protein 1 [Jiangsu sediment cysto-like virus3]